MKKTIFILAALFAATLANAQITLVKTLPGAAFATANISIGTNGFTPHYGYLESPYLYTCSRSSNQHSCTICLYDKQSLELYKSFTLEKEDTFWFFSYGCIVTKNILTTEGKTCICIPGVQNNQCVTCVYDEDGVLVQTLNGICPHIFLMDGGYFLTTFDSWPEVQETYVYSLPGNGEPQAISNPSPKRSARKIARDGQVLVETDTNTYTLQGAEVK